MPSENLNSENIFHKAIEMANPTKRAAFLDKACKKDKKLRAEIEALLKAHEEAGDFLETPSIDQETTFDTRSLDTSVKGPGSKIRQFHIKRELGRGGMGVVYLAYDTKLNRPVAIKSLPAEIMHNAQARLRFSREARVLASLNHPNIATIYEELEDAESTGFLVLEYIPGQTLAERIAESSLKLEEALTMALQISEAVAVAHEHGIIHRDLKPSNIKITPEGRIKVLDFGIAKVTGGRPFGQQSTTTGSGQIIGTPAYMSPEQVRGKSIDTRTDIWSFGCIMFELISGRIPFKGDTMADTLARVIEYEPDWELLPQDTPTNIRVLLHHCLEKNPRKRLRDIGDAAIEIIEILKSTPSPLRGIELKSDSFKADAESLNPDLQVPTNKKLAMVCPYQGLRPFRETDAPFFFGREAFTELLAEVVAQHTMIAVVGASGSGKSSVVRAGLVPYVRKGVGGKVWDVVILVPSDHPLRALAAALVPFLEHDMTEADRLGEIGKLADHFAKRNVALHDVVARLLEKRPGTDHLLLIVDQWEELYTLVHDDQTRQLFINELLEATKQGNLTVVLTIRGDFFGHVLAHRALTDRLQNTLVSLGPMTREELSHAIEAPAQKVGLTFEPGLVSRILNDVEEEPGSLPLLEFVLTSLWERRRGRMLLHEVYENIGELQGAIARRADEVFEIISPSEQKVLRQVFLQLVRPGEGTEDTRRRATLAEMNEAARQIVQYLAEVRLIVTARNEATGEQTVEVAHEALIRNWNRLKGWLDEDREFLYWKQRLRAHLDEWEVIGDEKGTLLHGAPLTEAERWIIERGEDINPSERELIEQSISWREQERIAHERLRKRIVTGLIVGMTIALVLAGLTGWQWHRAEKQRRIVEAQKKLALARQLVAQAELTRTQQPNLLQRSVLLAVESMRRFPSLEADQALRNGLVLLAHPVAAISHTVAVCPVAFSPDGKYLATVSDATTARLWDVTSGKVVARMNHKNWVRSITFSPDGKNLATASQNIAQVWDATSGKAIARVDHEDSVRSIAFSPDGKYLATGSRDRTARVWDPTSGKEIANMNHGDPVLYLAFSPDGRYLATAGVGNTARVWEATEGREVAPMKHEAYVRSIAFSPDGKYLATASEDKTARVWEVTSAKEIARMNHGDIVRSVAFSPGGEYLITASEDKTARVWEVTSSKEIARMDHEDIVRSAALSPDGNYLATASEDKTARVWEVNSGKEVARMNHEHIVRSAALSPDGKYLATVSDSKSAWLWEATDSQEVAPMRHKDSVRSVVFSPDGKYLATASGDKTARVWDATGGQEVALMYHKTYVRSVAFSPDGKYLATASGGNTARVWDATSDKVIARMSHGDVVRSIAFSQDGKYLATASVDNTARVWEATSSKKEVARMNHDDIVYSVAFSPDGKYLATVSDDKTARVWDATGGKEVERMNHEACVRSVAFSPDGKYLATASDDHAARVWEVTTGEPIARMSHEEVVNSIALSPDGKYLATASSDHAARIWEVTTGEQIARMSHDGKVNFVVFSPDDGKYLATASSDHAARIWEVMTGEPIARMSHEQPVTSVAFSPNGKYLATASDDKTARMWLWQPKDLIDEAASRLTRNLTFDEWLRYFPDESYTKTCPNLPIHPTFIEAGRDLARAGDVKGAVTIFRRAKELEPTLDLDYLEEIGNLAP